jgi:hypothetical protein
LEQLTAAGACILQPVSGGGRVVWGLTTTQSGLPEEEEISIVFIRDAVAKILRGSFTGFVGLPESTTISADLNLIANKTLQGLVGSMITNFAVAGVTRDPLEPRQWNIIVKVQPTYPVNWIYIKVNVGLI